MRLHVSIPHVTSTLCMCSAVCKWSFTERRLTVLAATAGRAREVLRARSPSMAHFLRLLKEMNAVPGQCGRVQILVASSSRNAIVPTCLQHAC